MYVLRHSDFISYKFAAFPPITIPVLPSSLVNHRKNIGLACQKIRGESSINSEKK